MAARALQQLAWARGARAQASLWSGRSVIRSGWTESRVRRLQLAEALLARVRSAQAGPAGWRVGPAQIGVPFAERRDANGAVGGPEGRAVTGQVREGYVGSLAARSALCALPVELLASAAPGDETGALFLQRLQLTRAMVDLAAEI